MALFEIDFVPDADSWGVYDSAGVPLTAESSKAAAKRFAKRELAPGDSVEVFRRDGSFEDEFIVDEDGELVAAEHDPPDDANGSMDGLFGANGNGNGNGGLFGGWG